MKQPYPYPLLLCSKLLPTWITRPSLVGTGLHQPTLSLLYPFTLVDGVLTNPLLQPVRNTSWVRHALLTLYLTLSRLLHLILLTYHRFSRPFRQNTYDEGRTIMFRSTKLINDYSALLYKNEHRWMHGWWVCFAWQEQRFIGLIILLRFTRAPNLRPDCLLHSTLPTAWSRLTATCFALRLNEIETCPSIIATWRCALRGLLTWQYAVTRFQPHSST
jgi:hypothetical protein